MKESRPSLPPEVFAAVVDALSAALVREYRSQWNRPDEIRRDTTPMPAATSPWLTLKEAAKRARCSEPTIRREAKAGRLRTVRVGGRRSLRFRAEWIDEWLQGQ